MSSRVRFALSQTIPTLVVPVRLLQSGRLHLYFPLCPVWIGYFPWLLDLAYEPTHVPWENLVLWSRLLPQSTGLSWMQVPVLVSGTTRVHLPVAAVHR